MMRLSSKHSIDTSDPYPIPINTFNKLISQHISRPNKSTVFFLEIKKRKTQGPMLHHRDLTIFFAVFMHRKPSHLSHPPFAYK